ncbi:PAS domain-containing protein [Desulforhopalus singaporensis]
MLVDRVLAQGELTNFESRLRRRDGTVIIGNLNVRLARDDRGEISPLEGFFENITAQKEVEQELRSSEEWYRSVFENTGAGTIIIEEDTTISLANTGFATLAGYSKEEIQSRMKWTDMVATPEERFRMEQYHYRRRRDGAAVPINYESTLKDRDGANKRVFLRVDLLAGT